MWGRTYQANATWFGTRCVITPDAITVRSLGHEHLHRKAEVTELRWLWLPFPGFVAINRHGSEYFWSGFCILRWHRLRQALSFCGYTFTSESRWPSLWQSRQDIRDFGLYDETG